MLRRLTSLGAVTLGVLCMAIRPHTPPPSPPPAPTSSTPPAPPPAPAPVPTAKKVVTTAPTPPPAPPHAPAAAPNTVEKARQGVVVLERQGKPLALGVVLEGDGRILSALSPLTTGNFLSARYADGGSVPVKLLLSDRAWDLALLSPVTSPAQPSRKSGLRAARSPSFVGLQTFVLAPPATVTATPAALQLSPGLLGGDGASLSAAYDLTNKPAFVGGPVVNPEGEVVALVARACPASSKAACVPGPYGAPVSALKQFLQRVPAEATWLGVEAAVEETSGVRGVRILSVVPNGPAAVAGVRPGPAPGQADIVVAVDGTPVATPAELNEAIRGRTTGDNVELLLFGMGRYRHVTVKPRPAPQVTVPPAFTPKPPAPRTPNPYR